MKAKTKNKIWTGVLSIGLISYVGSKLFAINQLIDYCEIEDIFWRIPIQTITIVAEVHAMSFTRVTSLYRKILNRSLPPSQPQSLSQEPATPSNSLTKRKTANVLTAVISASAFINGVCPAILLTYLGTKTLLPSNLKKINVIMDGATLVMLLSNFATYFSFSFPITFQNGKKIIYGLMFPNQNFIHHETLAQHQIIKRKATVTTTLISLPWAIAATGLSTLQFRYAYTGNPITAPLPTVTHKPITIILAVNWTFNRFISRLGDTYNNLYQHFYPSPINNHNSAPTITTHTIQGDTPITNHFTQQQTFWFNASKYIGATHLLVFGSAFYIGFIDFVKYCGQEDLAAWWVTLLSAICTLSSTTIEYHFTYYRMMNDVCLALGNNDNQVKALKEKVPSISQLINKFKRLGQNTMQSNHEEEEQSLLPNP